MLPDSMLRISHSAAPTQPRQGSICGDAGSSRGQTLHPRCPGAVLPTLSRQDRQGCRLGQMLPGCPARALEGTEQFPFPRRLRLPKACELVQNDGPCERPGAAEAEMGECTHGRVRPRPAGGTAAPLQARSAVVLGRLTEKHLAESTGLWGWGPRPPAPTRHLPLSRG